MISARRAPRAAAAALMVGLLAAGCATEEPGTPSASSWTSSADNSTSASGGDVPQVSSPLDASAYLDRPCDLVPQTVMNELSYTEPGKALTADENSTAALSGPGCGWNVRGHGQSVVVGIQTGNQQDGMGGLQGIYDGYQDGQFEYYEPTTVDGYPAAFSDISDNRDRGSCAMYVGIADDLTYSVYAGPYGDDPDAACPVVEQVAGAVIETLKGGA
ncbi:DUF3558 domain-containing protein [Prauserella endophytica]|uniref:DUF3558 domain-containing protein n=1 Tax=Prauserella endophytica TaxID=1592324 RepID=A0ABY2RTY5_9PSEU|nr:DUF3558 domain-containing protein [Prauserella endophytica]TKG60447.1 DUF3558 domain-containing protein [Prauserella endophytica]